MVVMALVTRLWLETNPYAQDLHLLLGMGPWASLASFNPVTSSEVETGHR